MSIGADRKQACDAYTEQYPDDEWDVDIHAIVSDYNFEDRWLFGAIAIITEKLRHDEANEDLRRHLLLLVELLRLPMPDDWEASE